MRCAWIIGNLDDEGFLSDCLEELARDGAQVIGVTEDLYAWQEALRLVQGLDPAGIAADGPTQSLLIQLSRLEVSEEERTIASALLTRMPEALAKLKINFDPVILAMTVAADMEGIRPADYDVMALYSPSDVKTVVESFGVDALPVVATFGDATLRAALGAGLKVRASAPSPEAPSMAKALDLYIGKLSRGEEVAEVEAKNDSAKEEFIRSQQSKLAKKSRVRHRP